VPVKRPMREDNAWGTCSGREDVRRASCPAICRCRQIDTPLVEYPWRLSIHGTMLDETRRRWVTFRAQRPLCDAGSHPIQPVASRLANWNMAARCIVLHSFQSHYKLGCTDQTPCSSSLPQAGSVRAACQRSLSKSAHGQSHQKKQTVLAEPHAWGYTR
jgi:hypothetical protein